jgi:CubicO group peptidase (beta-lactamase class C family)
MPLETDFPKAHAVYQKGIDRAHHFGVQVYVSRDGETLVNEALGARNAEGDPLTRDDLMLWKSSGKPVAAIALAQLHEVGKLGYDDLVAKHIPEFAQGGKDAITIRHLLTHQGGFRPTPFTEPPADWDNAIQVVCAIPLEEGWIIGETAGYHAITAWYILAEIVRRVDGRAYTDYIRDEIFVPLDMDTCYIGMPDDTYDALAPRIAPVCNTTRGKQEWLTSTERRWVTRCVPGANARGPVRELGRMYESLLNAGAGPQGEILQPESVAELVRRHRVGLPDKTFRSTMDWGLGFILNSNKYGPMTFPYGYGLHASENTFGHGGRETTSAFADPAHNLVVIASFNGMPGEPRHNQRVREFNTAIYEDLGLA